MCSRSLRNTWNTLGKVLWIHAGYVFNDTWDKWCNIGFAQWRNHVEVLVPEDNCKTSKCKNISKFTIFVSMFSDCRQILLRTLNKFKQINYITFIPLKIIRKPWFLECLVTYKCLKIIYTTKNFLTEYKVVSSCQLIFMKNLFLISRIDLRLLCNLRLLCFPCDKLGNDMILDKF